MKRIIIKLTLEELLTSNGEIIIEVEPASASAVAEADVGLLDLLGQMEADCRAQQRMRTAETYRSAMNSFRRFRQGADIPLAQVNAAVAMQYEQWLHHQGIKPNSCSFYMRRLRAAYNSAVARGLTADRRPFDRVYTGVAHTRKRAVSVDVMRRLEAMELTDHDARFARDMFLFSFYAQGMPFVDMAYLKRTDIQGGQLVYRRRKTGQLITIAWTQRLQDIANRYPPTADPYLLPIIRSRTGRERSQMRRCQLLVNTKLGELSASLGISGRLTLYCARHSWASIAHELGVPLPVISRALGHTSERTTRIYLADVSTDRVALANRLVQDSLHPTD